LAAPAVSEVPPHRRTDFLTGGGRVEFFEVLEGLRRFGFVYDADGEAGVDDDVISNLCLRGRKAKQASLDDAVGSVDLSRAQAPSSAAMLTTLPGMPRQHIL